MPSPRLGRARSRGETKVPHSLQKGPSALIVAHSGHELFVSAWLRRSRPLVFILTDGSGRKSAPRVETSRCIVKSVGGRAGSVFGRCSDQAIYRAVIGRDLALFAGLAAEISQALADAGIRQVVFDAYERQYLSHDLCHIIASAAVAQAENLSGTAIHRLVYPMFGYFGQRRQTGAGDAVGFELDDEGLEWKIRSARSFPDPALQKEVDDLIAQRGRDGLRREALLPTDPQSGFEDPEIDPPRYEAHGEKLVAQGHYGEVIRYREHVAPLAAALKEFASSPQRV